VKIESLWIPLVPTHVSYNNILSLGFPIVITMATNASDEEVDSIIELRYGNTAF